MLVLSRKIGEQVVIGDKITVTIMEVKGDSVRLAFDAPKDIKIYRGEIYAAIASENKQAAVASTVGELDMLKEITKDK
jgi:carbon storage regulator